MKELDELTYEVDKKVWRVTRLIQLASELKSFKIPLKHLSIYSLYPKFYSDSPTNEFVDYIRSINSSDLSYPIILDDEGYVMDGRHRVFKSMLENKKSILAVRFDKTPECDFIKE